jgi:hypothetical protein
MFPLVAGIGTGHRIRLSPSPMPNPATRNFSRRCPKGEPAGSSRLNPRRERMMTAQSTEKKTWREKITLAAVAGLMSGATRALLSWTLHQLH